MDIMLTILKESWHILHESAVFMLFGFLVAGLLKAFLPDDFVARHLGKGKTSGVIKASALGVPIPLCSCGVIPAAAGLRRQGAGKGATAAFLISTPETGVDSIAVTYALLDPLMTLLRPLAAFITATCAGIFINECDREPEHPQDVSPAGTLNCSCCPSGACTRPVLHRLREGLSYAFNDLLGDIGLWFLGGVLIAGFIAALIPSAFIEAHLGEGFVPLLIMLLVGIPLYVCATATTPIAAALALKGLSPGAALVFLLAGPATNAASLAVVAKMLGKRATALYLAAIIVCSLALGVLTNYLYGQLDLSVTDWVQKNGVHDHAMLSHVFPAILLGCILLPLFKKYFLKESSCTCDHHHDHEAGHEEARHHNGH